MIRSAVALLTIASVTACASAPAPSPATQILGTWTCTSAAEGMAVAATLDYAADGTVKGQAKMDSKMQGMDATITGDLTASWEFLPDGKLKETITALTVKSASMAGQAAPASMIPTMIQPMVTQSVVNQASISTAVFAADTFTSTDEDGVVTNCKR